jgi:hypothetical protein
VIAGKADGNLRTVRRTARADVGRLPNLRMADPVTAPGSPSCVGASCPATRGGVAADADAQSTNDAGVD